MPTYKLYTDGGCRNNGATDSISAIGFVIYCDTMVVTKHSEIITGSTNNVAEYVALIKGLAKLISMGCKKIDIYLDSQLVVEQVKGNYKVKNTGLRLLHTAAMDKLKNFEWTITHIKRELNKEADALVNMAFDKYLSEQP